MYLSESGLSVQAKVLAIVTLVAVIIVGILFFSSVPDRQYASLYFSANDVNSLSITDRIDFSFVIKNHFNSDRNVSYEVTVGQNLLKRSSVLIPANGSAVESLVLPFNKNSFNQKKVVVSLPDENESIFFEAGLKVNTSFLNNLALVDAGVLPDVVSGDQNINMYLDWTALERTDQNYMIFVHFINNNDVLVFQDDHYPTVDGNVIMTSQWLPDEQIKENFSIPVPQGVPDGNYRVLTGFYIPGQLRVKTKLGDDFALIKEISLRSG